MPKPNLSQRKIVDSAIDLADEEGLEAVSLRRLAKRLNVHVTSLYNHVPTKQALFTEMMKALVAKSVLPTGELSWQEWLRQFAIAIRSLARQHPGAFELFHRGTAQGELAMLSLESAIAAFRSDGFSKSATFGAISAVNFAVLGMVMDDTGRHLRPAAREQLGELPPDDFPNIHSLLENYQDADRFNFLLDVLIDGISANRS